MRTSSHNVRRIQEPIRVLSPLLDSVYKQHDPGPGHPEQPARYDAVTRAIEGLVSYLNFIAWMSVLRAKTKSR